MEESEIEVNYTNLQNLLEQQNWKGANIETADKILQAIKKGCNGVNCTFAKETIFSWWQVMSPDILSASCKDFYIIDQLWIKNSEGQFGFSIQKKIWQECAQSYPFPSDWVRYDSLNILEKLSFIESYNAGWLEFLGRVGWLDHAEFNGHNATFDLHAPQGHLPIAVIKMGNRAFHGNDLLGGWHLMELPFASASGNPWGWELEFMLLASRCNL